jgi:exopolyphosphatase/guanosine-5'-triphosphate,3'-diphosphate pyrophosphatase
MRIAVIDCGTNTFHLLVGEKNGKGLKTLFQEKIPVKIGQQGISKGFINPEAGRRAIWTLKRFADILDEYQVEQLTAIATSAFRNAKNGKALVKKIKKHTGIELEIISGQREATLIYEGVIQAVSLKQQNSLIIDIGGGSVEFVVANSEGSLWMDSFEIGAQRLLDQFHKKDPITKAEADKLNAFLNMELQRLDSAIEKFNPVELIGSSGTFDTLSSIQLKRKSNTLHDCTSYELEMDFLHETIDQIIAKNKAERMAIPGMAEMRVDMIVVSVLLIKYLLRKYRFSMVRTSSFALKEGLISTTFSRALKTA